MHFWQGGREKFNFILKSHTIIIDIEMSREACFARHLLPEKVFLEQMTNDIAKLFDSPLTPTKPKNSPRGMAREILLTAFFDGTTTQPFS